MAVRALGSIPIDRLLYALGGAAAYVVPAAVVDLTDAFPSLIVALVWLVAFQAVSGLLVRFARGRSALMLVAGIASGVGLCALGYLIPYAFRVSAQA